MIIDFIVQNWIFLLILLGSFLAILLLYLVFNMRTAERPRRTETQPAAPEPKASDPSQNEAGNSTIEPIVVGGEIVAKPISPHETTPAAEPAVPEPKAPVSPEPATAPAPVEAQTPPATPQKPKKTLGRYHVLYRAADDAWIVKREGSDRILRVLETQKDAITFANIKALSNDTQIVIHKKDGKIRKQNYRKDDEA